MKDWFIGCSGFSYKHWKGRFYPDKLPQTKWFEYYCQHFNTVELNVTFYRIPKLDVFKGWYDRSTEDFKFTVKAPRLITHYKKFRNLTFEVEKFYDIIAVGLQEKIGSVLFQLHPWYAYSEENLSLLLTHLHPAYPNVVEFRHQSWWNKKVYKVLKEHNIAFCGISYPSLPDEVVKTSPIVYYRFHGVPQLYRSPYTNSQLASIVSQIKIFKNLETIYVYFNNDIDVHAVENAKTIQNLVGAGLNIQHLPVKSI